MDARWIVVRQSYFSSPGLLNLPNPKKPFPEQTEGHTMGTHNKRAATMVAAPGRGTERERKEEESLRGLEERQPARWRGRLASNPVCVCVCARQKSSFCGSLNYTTCVASSNNLTRFAQLGPFFFFFLSVCQLARQYPLLGQFGAGCKTKS